MNLYVCATPVQFPSSEYGGLVVTMAKNPKRLGEILTEYYQHHGRYFDLDLSVRTVKALALDPVQDYAEGIVEDFLT